GQVSPRLFEQRSILLHVPVGERLRARLQTLFCTGHFLFERRERRGLLRQVAARQTAECVIRGRFRRRDAFIREGQRLLLFSVLLDRRLGLHPGLHVRRLLVERAVCILPATLARIVPDVEVAASPLGF